MPGSIMLLLAGLAFLAGMVVGFRIQEHGTQRRERLVTAQRRDLAERARALDAYHGVAEVVWDARERERGDVVLRSAPPLVVVDQDDADPLKRAS